MVFVRVNFVYNAGSTLGRACTIAIRYSAVRRQFPSKENPKQELQVLDYQSQQYRLLPLLATAYAMHFTGERMLALYNDLMSSLTDLSQEKIITEKLAEVHATSSGLKSLTTELTAKGIEECRLCCGGHGYSQMSGLPSLYATYVHKSTAEGDNWMLTQQVARHLFKCSESPVGSTTEYLKRYKGGANLDEKCSAKSVQDFLDPRVQLQAFQHRAARLVHETAVKAKSGIENALIEVAQTSRSHSLLTMVQSFTEAHQYVKNTTLLGVLKMLSDLFALYHIEEGAIQFLEDGYMNRDQLTMVRQAVRSLLKRVRQDAVALVDAFNFSDYQLNSALGKYDGHVYEALFKWMKEEPLNASNVPDGYEQHLKPLFTSKL
jgi:acyl-CoA oxidase